MAYEAVPVVLTARRLVGTGEFPTWPGIQDSGLELEEADTGNIWRWTGAYWKQTHAHGRELVAENPYGVEHHYGVGAPNLVLDSLAVAKFTMLTSDTDLVLEQIFLQSNANIIEVEMWEGIASPAGGTVVTPTNLDRQSLEVFPGVHTQFVTSWQGGTKILAGSMLGTSQKTSFANGDRLINIRLKQDTLYGMNIINTDTTGGIKDTFVSWNIGH